QMEGQRGLGRVIGAGRHHVDKLHLALLLDRPRPRALTRTRRYSDPTRLATRAPLLDFGSRPRGVAAFRFVADRRLVRVSGAPRGLWRFVASASLSVAVTILELAHDVLEVGSFRRA